MSSTTAAAPPAAAGKGAGIGGLTHRQILTVLSGLILGMLLAALDQTIVSTSITTIANDLHGLDLQAWATTAYLITSTISTPLYGKLSDQYGRKPFFIFAISIFVLGSVACTFSTSMYMLAAFRAVQGIGAGGLMSLALAIIGDIVPPRQRAKYQGYLLAVFATSSVAGPVIGGALAGQSSILGIDGWRWVFLVNVPVGIIALIVVTRVLKGRIGGGIRHRLDWTGAGLLIVGLVPLLIVAEQGRDWGWASLSAFLCYVIGALGLAGFIFVERRMGDDALIPLRLFQSRVFSIVNAGGLLVGLAMFGAISMLPQFLQIVRGASPTESGLLMLPFVGGMMVFSIVSGQITAHTGRYKFLPVIGTALMVTAALLFAFRLNADMPLWETDIYMVIFGAGLGLCMQTLSLAAQNSVPARDMGVATSTSTSFRQLGGTLGVAVFFSVLFSTVGGKIASAFASAAPTPSFQAAINDPTVVDNPANKPVLDMLHGGGFGGGGGGVLQDASFLRTIDPRLAHPFFVGFSNAMIIVFICAAAIAAIALVLFAFMKEVPLRQYSGLQEAAMEQAAIADGGEQPAPATAARPVAEVPAEETMRLPVAAGAPGLRSPSAQNGHAAVATRPVRDENLVAPQGGGTPIRGQVRRPDGSGIAGATLTLIDAAGRQVARGIARGEGGYGMGAPGPGTFVLIASAGSHQPTASTVVVGSGPVDLDVVLTATAGLTGVVRAADGGAPIAGATTTLADGRGEVVSSQLTGAAGEYTFSDLMEGSYTLVVSAQAHRPNASMVTVSGTGQTHQDVELVTAARLRGAALIGDSDRRVIDARITLLDAGGNVVAVANTDETGEYSFDDLVAGEYTVVASGFPVVTSTLRTVGGEVSQHDVKFSHTQ